MITKPKMQSRVKPTVLLTALVLSACAPEQDVAMPEAREGAMLLAENCAMGHGTDGRGAASETAVIRNDVTPAADLTVLAQGNDGVFPRQRVLATIDGYNRQTIARDRMPEFGGFLGGDTVPVALTDDALTDEAQLTPVPRRLAALMAYLETLQTP
jgi:hypothetical protein